MSQVSRSSEMSAQRRGVLAIVFAVALSIVFVAERDLHQRPEADVRGKKVLWRVVCLNALGALAYLRWGRRSSPDHPLGPATASPSP
jgi:hypothetical protein